MKIGIIKINECSGLSGQLPVFRGHGKKSHGLCVCSVPIHVTDFR